MSGLSSRVKIAIQESDDLFAWNLTEMEEDECTARVMSIVQPELEAKDQIIAELVEAITQVMSTFKIRGRYLRELEAAISKANATGVRE